MSRPRAIVVGAGISGLTAAYRMRDSFELTVLEASDRIGGQIQTEERGGMLLEWGPDSLVAYKPAGERLCRELGLGEKLIRLRSGGSRMQVVHGNRLQQVPDGFLMIAPTRLSTLLTTPLLSPLGSLRAACERFIPPRRETVDESVCEFVTRRWGRELYERIAEPVLGGLFSADATRLSAKSCIPRMHGLEGEHGNVSRGLAKMMTASEKAQRPRPGVYALDGGMGVIIDELASKLPPWSVRTGTSVRSLRRDGRGWLVETDTGESIATDRVVLACPTYVAARLLRETDAELAAHLDAIEYVSVATVNLLYDASALQRPLQGFGFFVARSEGSPLLACNYTSLKFEGRAPHGCVMLRAFLGGAGREPLDQFDDGRLVQIAHEALARLLDLRGAPRFGRARRFPNAMPHQVVGIGERRAALATGLPGLALCGSACGALGLPDCIESAETAAARFSAEIERSSGIEQAG